MKKPKMLQRNWNSEDINFLFFKTPVTHGGSILVIMQNGTVLKNENHKSTYLLFITINSMKKPLFKTLKYV